VQITGVAYETISTDPYAWTKKENEIRRECLSYLTKSPENKGWIKYACSRGFPPPRLGHGSDPGGSGSAKDQEKFGIFLKAMKEDVKTHYGAQKRHYTVAMSHIETNKLPTYLK
jgi:hypothetical protein